MEKLVNAVNEVSSKYFFAELNEFRFSRLYQCFLGRDHQESLKEVFGESLFWRLKLHFKNLRKKVPFEPLNINLPADSIIFYKKDKKGFIIASPSKKLALKIFLDAPHIKLLDSEIETLKKIKGTPFEKSASIYITDGVTSNGARWVISDFRSNRDSLFHTQDPDQLLFNLSYQEIMPRMAEFYRINAPDTLALKVWISKAEKRAEDHPLKDLILKGLCKIKVSDEVLLISAIHYDLHAGNILREKDQYSFIDWEGNLRGLVLIDGFDFLRRYLQKNQSQMMLFSDSLRKGVLAPKAKEVARNLLEWQFKEFNLSSNIEPLNLIYIYAIERTLLLWEVRRVNRLTDKRGIEFNVLGS